MQAEDLRLLLELVLLWKFRRGDGSRESGLLGVKGVLMWYVKLEACIRSEEFDGCEGLMIGKLKLSNTWAFGIIIVIFGLLDTLPFFYYKWGIRRFLKLKCASHALGILNQVWEGQLQLRLHLGVI